MRYALWSAALILTSLTGCAMTGGEEEGAIAGAPRNVDAVYLRSGDVVVGELALPEGKISLENDAIAELNLEKRHLESLRVLRDGRIRVATKHGDSLQGRMKQGSLLLHAKTGDDVTLSLEAIDRITFAE